MRKIFDWELQMKFKGSQPPWSSPKPNTQLAPSFCKFQQFYSPQCPIFHLVQAPTKRLECTRLEKCVDRLRKMSSGMSDWGCSPQHVSHTPNAHTQNGQHGSTSSTRKVPFRIWPKRNTHLVHKHYTRPQSSCLFFSEAAKKHVGLR